jgi:hypothetical protein
MVLYDVAGEEQVAEEDASMARRVAGRRSKLDLG